jgi:3-oxoacyl-[acyl-carrier protein] reductase
MSDVSRADQVEDPFSLSGKVAVITAAASGMGRAGAILMAARGAHVELVDLDGSGLEATATEITAAGGSVAVHAFDLTDQAELEGFLAGLATEHEAIDILYNHAGIPGPPEFEYDNESFDACMGLNIRVPMITTQRLLPQLRRSAAASLIYTASTSGLVASPYRPLYAASKGAVVQFMKSVAVALGPEGIRANAICPGPTATAALEPSFQDEKMSASLAAFLETVPLRRAGDPRELANVALFLACDASKFLTGAAIPVDGGYVAA